MEDNQSTIPNAYEDSNIDRGDLVVSSRKKKKKVAIVILIVVVVVVIGLSAILTINNLATDEEEDTVPVTNNTQDVSGVEKETVGNNNNWFDDVKRQHEKEQVAQQRAEARTQREQAQTETQPAITVKTTGVPEPQVEPRQSRNTGRDKNAPPTPQERRLMSGIMIDQPGTGSSQNTAAASAESNDNRYNAPTFAKGSAYKRNTGSLDFLLRHGSVIPCALYTQVISDYQGIVTCRVTQDIYSANGKALLVERGSLLTGTQSVELEAGKNRVFTTWADIETPNGVAIRIDSLGAGALGASGNEAWIDNHFQQRFGGAILLSFLDDAFDALSNKVASSSNSDITFDNSTQTASDIAEKALDSTINIKPTGYTKIGQRINIIVARDIDMSTVYEFR